ncbi:intercompartmental signaling factor BofC [Lederbergia citrea]|uniref:Intercompartmental signaling factor BofC n=1 Tax=Lederbergia citrea TaxID=2833581 RepID=A0A942UKV8_9BACI|nr:intercompartmental signaling factor BofC [Lederbergia citrea]MBS4176212.1 intercompartmental signaling factor BofC [Lederbergia citrea]MBS4202772.1 intercompartmental signaling factor BofC [Lederbergia citrea]MBS4222560.1 intercompartmental signaling factor BofC [Lederbergia citrea]
MKCIVKMIISLMLLFSCLSLFYFAGQQPTRADERTPSNAIKELDIPDNPLILDVTLKRKYIDGEISEETVKETIWALEDFWTKYETWQLVDMDEDHLVFELFVDDISPLLKLNGFFGLSEDGILSIYNGKPDQEDIIQSFFQIDIKKLEGKKRDQLKQGIPVKTKEDFTEVLEAMKNYSLE